MYIVTCQAHPVLVKKGRIKYHIVRELRYIMSDRTSACGFIPFKIVYLGGYLASLLLSRSGPPVDGPKDPWPRVL